jgi:hypothetical protein
MMKERSLGIEGDGLAARSEGRIDGEGALATEG